MTHLGFAQNSGIPVRSIYNYMDGKREPNTKALTKLSRMGVNINWLLTGDGFPFNRDYLNKKIVDKLIIIFLHSILEYIFSKKDRILNYAERKDLVSYMMNEDHLGLGGAIRTLIEEGAIEGFGDLESWLEELKYMITPPLDSDSEEDA